MNKKWSRGIPPRPFFSFLFSQDECYPWVLFAVLFRNFLKVFIFLIAHFPRFLDSKRRTAVCAENLEIIIRSYNASCPTFRAFGKFHVYDIHKRKPPKNWLGIINIIPIFALLVAHLCLFHELLLSFFFIGNLRISW